MSPTAVPLGHEVIQPTTTEAQKPLTSVHADNAETLSAVYHQAVQKYTVNNPKSRDLYNEATRSLPGGNTRTVLYYDPFPMTVTGASGARLFTADGDEYTDFLGEYTAGMYGHSEPIIVAAITKALHNGLSFGSHHADEALLAQLIKDRFASIDLLRFTNSGTEASLMALGAAKVYVGRKKVVVFEGAYHGGAFSFKYGNSPINAPHEYLIAQYNDEASVESIISEHAADIAVVIVEPMIGSGGGIPATKEFLTYLRKRTTEIGAVLIFDEVMTSRMYSGGGVQSEFGIKPCMTTLGKYIGGGMSFGAFGGKKEIMTLFDPRSGKLPHAGTFNNNVLTMAAGRAGLEHVFTTDVARRLHGRGETLRAKLNSVASDTLLKVTGLGSILVFHFTSTPLGKILRPSDVETVNHVLGDLLHLYLLSKGIYIAQRGFVSLSLPLSDDDLDRFVTAIAEFIVEYRHLL